MKHSEVIRLAEQAGCQIIDGYGVKLATYNDNRVTNLLERFAVLVIADFLEKSGQYVTNDASRAAVVADAVKAEREACAKVCEESEIPFDIDLWCDSTKKEMTAHTANALAAMIRARGNADA